MIKKYFIDSAERLCFCSIWTSSAANEFVWGWDREWSHALVSNYTFFFNSLHTSSSRAIARAAMHWNCIRSDVCNATSVIIGGLFASQILPVLETGAWRSVMLFRRHRGRSIKQELLICRSFAWVSAYFTRGAQGSYSSILHVRTLGQGNIAHLCISNRKYDAIMAC